MNSFLAQTRPDIPGYASDVWAKGGPSNMFANFFNLFSPNAPSYSLGSLISRLLPFSFVAAGMIFFVKLILAGYAYMTSVGDSGKIQSASKDLANSAVGLFITISSYFLAQIIQVVFGIKFL